MAQPTERPEIQTFLTWLKINCEKAVVDSNSEVGPEFVPLKTVRDYLGANNNAELEKIITAVFYPRGVPVDIDDILQNYLQIFCILVDIGKARFLEVFSSHDLSDRLLPFDPESSPPTHFPLDPTDQQLYQTFCDKQWRFCAADFRFPMSRTTFPDKRVLPIISKERIAGGGSAILYKIRLHSSYNKLHRQGIVSRHFDNRSLLSLSLSSKLAPCFYSNPTTNEPPSPQMTSR